LETFIFIFYTSSYTIIRLSGINNMDIQIPNAPPILFEAPLTVHDPVNEDDVSSAQMYFFYFLHIFYSYINIIIWVFQLPR